MTTTCNNIIPEDWIGAAADADKGYSFCLQPRDLNLREMAMSMSPINKPHWKTEVFIAAGERIVHTICDAYDRGKVHQNRFVSISSRQLDSMCGRDSNRKRRYKEVLAMLSAFGVIEVNSRYSTGAGNYGNSFSKSFRLGSQFRRGLTFGVSMQEARLPRRAITKQKRYSQLVHEFWAKNAARVRIDAERLRRIVETKKLSCSRWKRILSGASKIQRGDVRFHEGTKQRRVYHTINFAPKELRGAITLDSEPLVEVDVRTCQPTLLLTICPKEEREEFKALLGGDFYGLSPSERDLAKSEFGRFAFGPYKRRNALGNAMQARFPNLASAIRGFVGSLSAHLQDLEAEICVHGIGRRLMDEGIFAIGIHDSFLVRREDAGRVAEIVREEFLRRIPDFEVEVRVKCNWTK